MCSSGKIASVRKTTLNYTHTHTQRADVHLDSSEDVSHSSNTTTKNLFGRLYVPSYMNLFILCWSAVLTICACVYGTCKSILYKCIKALSCLVPLRASIVRLDINLYIPFGLHTVKKTKASKPCRDSNERKWTRKEL